MKSEKRSMKKTARFIGVILLLFVVGCGTRPISHAYSGLGQYVANAERMREFGMNMGLGGKNMRHNMRNGKIDSETASKVQGVIFQETAKPAGNAVGKPVAIAYSPARADGQRLRLAIGGKAVTAALYDWEMIPIARFADSGYTACVTLADDAVTDDEKRLDNINKAIMWANFHPDLANTLVGLNLFLADAMLVNPYLMQSADEVFDTRIPGYHIPRQNKSNTDEIVDLYIDKLWFSYIYTDYGKQITYSVKNNRIEFNGTPFYCFLEDICEYCDSVIEAEELNESFIKAYSDIYDINPTVYRTAERTAQWAAFFRMVKEDYPQVWQRFMRQINGIAVPAVETPRYWLPLTERK